MEIPTTEAGWLEAIYYPERLVAAASERAGKYLRALGVRRSVVERVSFQEEGYPLSEGALGEPSLTREYRDKGSFWRKGTVVVPSFVAVCLEGSWSCADEEHYLVPYSVLWDLEGTIERAKVVAEGIAEREEAAKVAKAAREAEQHEAAERRQFERLREKYGA